MSEVWVEEGVSRPLSCSCLEYSFYNTELGEMRNAGGLSLPGKNHSPGLMAGGGVSPIIYINAALIASSGTDD